MRRLFIPILILLLASSGYAQQPANKSSDEREVKKLALLSELQFLATDSLNLDQPLARAEIADAAWRLDSA